MLYYGTANENISGLKIIASKVADIRDDVMYMSNQAHTRNMELQSAKT